MRMYLTVEFLISGYCGDFTFNLGDIYEMVLVTEQGEYWILTIHDKRLYFKKDEIREVVKFLNPVKV